MLPAEVAPACRTAATFMPFRKCCQSPKVDVLAARANIQRAVTFDV
jgi:hypothetical protein